MDQNGITVLSLFDGISCGHLALDRAGIPVKSYYASEIDKNAISITQKHYPDTIQLGDISKVRYEGGKLYSASGVYEVGQIDLVMGGSPCQGFSFQGKRLNLDDPRSKLFFEFNRILKEVQPKYFFLENVRMQRQSQDAISGLMGVQPVLINSAIVSAQNRPRLYWTNLPAPTITDRGIPVKDILQDGPPESFCWLHDWQEAKLARGEYKFKDAYKILSPDSLKARCVLTHRHSSQSNKVKIGEHIRWLSEVELERLQTLPDGWTEGLSAGRRCHAIGNGWTVDVISEFFKGLTA